MTRRITNEGYVGVIRCTDALRRNNSSKWKKTFTGSIEINPKRKSTTSRGSNQLKKGGCCGVADPKHKMDLSKTLNSTLSYWVTILSGTILNNQFHYKVEPVCYRFLVSLSYRAQGLHSFCLYPHITV